MHPLARPFVAYFRWCEARHPHISKSMAMRVYLLLATTLITSVLMWTYAWVSFLYVDDSLLKILGFAYAALHLSGPLVFRQTGSMPFATYIMLLSGGIFQVHFSWLTGGFYTTTVIWVGILPLIAGLMTNIRHTIVWSIFALGSIVLLMSLELVHYPFPQLMRKEGLFLTHLCVLIGMIVLNSGFTIFLILLDQSQVGNQANKTLEKQNLVRVLAHDIANPLSIIANCNSILMKGTQNPERQLKMQSMIDRASQQIADILNTVRQLEACESGKMTIELKSQKVLPLIEQCLEHFKSSIVSKNIKVNIDCPEHIAVLTHATLVQNQIFGNIISNAIKFSPLGGTIYISGHTADNQVHIQIHDQGAGIPKSLQKLIFSPTASTTQPGSAGELGTGFGLPIAYKFAQFLSGRLAVESACAADGNKDTGTTFSVVLPLATTPSKDSTIAA